MTHCLRWVAPAAALAIATVTATGEAFAASPLPQRQHILVVGSSTAYPIISAAAEYFARQPGMASPVIESTGSGGGIKLFCGGYGLSFPDIAMASRRMKQSERENCAAAQVYDIREIKIGFDGIVIASSRDAPRFELTKRNLYLALSRDVPDPAGSGSLVPNPYTSWHQIDEHLPQSPIRVLGPPPTSGTRDILLERVLEPACRATPAIQQAFRSTPGKLIEQCHALREDGAFVEAGENDARIVRKLLNDPDALGVFGYSFLDRNPHRLQAASIDEVLPTFDSIESGRYPLSRPLFIYTKPAHGRVVKGLDRFIEMLTSSELSGPEGRLADHGLVPLPTHGAMQISSPRGDPQER